MRSCWHHSAWADPQRKGRHFASLRADRPHEKRFPELRTPEPLIETPQLVRDTPPNPATASVVNDDTADAMAAMQGDLTAFTRLYDRHAAVVLSLCRRRTITDAEDAMQETFLRAHRKIDQLRDASRFAPWLYGIARRVCSERRRSARRRTHHEGVAMTQMITNNHTHTPSRAADVAEHDERLEMLGEALEQLDDRERLAIHMHYLEPDPLTAAKASLGLSRSAYYKLLARARERLAVLLREVQPL